MAEEALDLPGSASETEERTGRALGPARHEVPILLGALGGWARVGAPGGVLRWDVKVERAESPDGSDVCRQSGAGSWPQPASRVFNEVALGTPCSTCHWPK